MIRSHCNIRAQLWGMSNCIAILCTQHNLNTSKCRQLRCSRALNTLCWLIVCLSYLLASRLVGQRYNTFAFLLSMHGLACQTEVIFGWLRSADDWHLLPQAFCKRFGSATPRWKVCFVQTSTPTKRPYFIFLTNVLCYQGYSRNGDSKNEK